jgi:hypothetical protein
MSQRAQILAALKRGEALSPMDALLRYKCFRLAARICDLRNEGYQVVTEIHVEPKRFARYRLTEKSL